MLSCLSLSKKREQKLISVSSSLSFNLICSAASFGHFLSLKRGLPVYGKHVKELARLTGRLATKSLVCIAKTFFLPQMLSAHVWSEASWVECSECNWCTIWTMLFLISGPEYSSFLYKWNFLAMVNFLKWDCLIIYDLPAPFFQSRGACCNS